MSKRRRFKQSISLKDRLAIFVEEALKKASKLPQGPRGRRDARTSGPIRTVAVLPEADSFCSA
jgi:hypothetical protein